MHEHHFSTKGNVRIEAFSASGDIFCTASLLHGGSLLQGDTFARRHLLLDVTFVWRNKASLLHGVTFSRKYLCTAKILYQGSAALHNLRANFTRKIC